MLARLHRYGPLNTHDLIKAFALVCMSIDHVGAYVLVDESWLRIFGRITFPMWFFLIGYARGSRIGTDLVVYGALLIGVHVLLQGALLPANALISIIACRLVLHGCARYDVVKRYPAELVVACIMLHVLLIPLFEYGGMAIAFAAFGRMVREEMHGAALMRIAAVLALCFTGFQIWAFGFTALQSLVVALGVGACCYYLYRFKTLPVHVPRALQWPMLVASRYSLEYYVLHRTALQAIGFAMGMSYGHFTWIRF